MKRNLNSDSQQLLSTKRTTTFHLNCWTREKRQRHM